MNIYEIYKENVLEIESGIPMVALGNPYGLIIVDNKIPVEVFIKCYLDKIYDSLKSLDNSDCDNIIREIMYFIDSRKKKGTAIEEYCALESLLKNLLENSQVCLDYDTEYLDSVQLPLILNLVDTIKYYLKIVPDSNFQAATIKKMTYLISKEIKEFRNSQASHIILTDNIFYCLKFFESNTLAEWKEIPLKVTLKETLQKMRNAFTKDKIYNNTVEQIFLKHFLIDTTLIFQKELTSLYRDVFPFSTFPGPTQTDFFNSIIASLKKNTGGKITSDYITYICDSYMKSVYFEDPSVAHSICTDYFVEDLYIEDLKKPHIICADLKQIKDTKELFTPLTLHYNGAFSQNALTILNNLQRCSFYKVYDLISRISHVREREYFRQFFDSITSYLENNYSIDIRKVWVRNISIKALASYNRNKLSYNIDITLGFAEEVEYTQETALLAPGLEAFYMPISLRTN